MTPEIFRLAKELATMVSDYNCGCAKSHHPDCHVGIARDLDRLILNYELQQSHAPAEPTEG